MIAPVLVPSDEIKTGFDTPLKCLFNFGKELGGVYAASASAVKCEDVEGIHFFH